MGPGRETGNLCQTKNGLKFGAVQIQRVKSNISIEGYYSNGGCF